jgi:hypothetical protein
MVESAIAFKLNEPTWFNKIDNIDEEVFGLKSQYFLLQLEKLLFVDEVGNKTSQANDGNVGGFARDCG